MLMSSGEVEAARPDRQVCNWKKSGFSVGFGLEKTRRNSDGSLRAFGEMSWVEN